MKLSRMPETLFPELWPGREHMVPWPGERPARPDSRHTSWFSRHNLETKQRASLINIWMIVQQPDEQPRNATADRFQPFPQARFRLPMLHPMRLPVNGRAITGPRIPGTVVQPYHPGMIALSRKKPGVFRVPSGVPDGKRVFHRPGSRISGKPGARPNMKENGFIPYHNKILGTQKLPEHPGGEGSVNV